MRLDKVVGFKSGDIVVEFEEAADLRRSGIGEEDNVALERCC